MSSAHLLPATVLLPSQVDGHDALLAKSTPSKSFNYSWSLFIMLLSSPQVPGYASTCPVLCATDRERVRTGDYPGATGGGGRSR